MLQIIGWMGCFYLFLKAFEFLNSKNYTNEEGKPSSAGTLGGVLAMLGALGFFFLLEAQVSESGVRSYYDSSPTISTDPMDENEIEEMERVAAEVEAAADEVMREIEAEMAGE